MVAAKSITSFHKSFAHTHKLITPNLTYLEGYKCGDIGKNLNDEKDAYDILHYPTDAENKTQKWLLSYSGFLVVV